MFSFNVYACELNCFSSLYHHASFLPFVIVFVVFLHLFFQCECLEKPVSSYIVLFCLQMQWNIVCENLVSFLLLKKRSLLKNVFDSANLHLDKTICLSLFVQCYFLHSYVLLVLFRIVFIFIFVTVVVWDVIVDRILPIVHSQRLGRDTW